MKINEQLSDKNIFMLVDGFGQGGIQQAYLILIEEYVSIFNSVTLIVAQKSSSDLGLPLSNNLNVINLNSGKLFDIKAIRHLRKLLVNLKPQFVISNMYRSQIWSAIVCTRSSKLIWVEQNTYITRKKSQWLLMRLLSKKVEKIVCISNEVKTLTNKKLNQSNKTVVIPNPIRAPRGSISVLSRANDFIFVGRMIPQKNPELMIESFSYFIKKFNTNSKLHLVGDGELTNSLKELSYNLGVLEKCFFHGWLSNQDTNKLMNKCKTLVSTSHIEGMALVRFEALANGCCVVTTDTGGSKQYLSPEENIGTFVVEHEMSTISSKMYDSLDSKYWSEKLILKRGHLVSPFNPLRIASELIS